jgi:hypothetical protein
MNDETLREALKQALEREPTNAEIKAYGLDQMRHRAALFNTLQWRLDLVRAALSTPAPTVDARLRASTIAAMEGMTPEKVAEWTAETLSQRVPAPTVDAAALGEAADKALYNERWGLPSEACNCHHGSARYCPVHTQADYDAAPSGAKRDELPRAEYARLRGIEDLARLIVDGWDHGYPLSDDTASESELIHRARAALRASAPGDEG